MLASYPGDYYAVCYFQLHWIWNAYNSFKLHDQLISSLTRNSKGLRASKLLYKIDVVTFIYTRYITPIYRKCNWLRLLLHLRFVSIPVNSSAGEFSEVLQHLIEFYFFILETLSDLYSMLMW